VTMFRDPKMIEVVAKHKPICIVSHLSPKSSTIADAHKNPQATTIKEVKEELLAKREELITAGVPVKNIILDPGIGFGKTMELNEELLQFAKQVPDIGVMIGYSRKRFLGEHRMELEPNLEAGKIAMNSGARYLRVHDVAGHKKLLD
ncbi:dihydropteroate synthase, partial [Candidatus Saccharibacteria bacterium]|nr:dihydropteroate synthase [Candidatus Saccharibacteria bacterium]